MDKIKEVVNDPVKLEQKLKVAFEKIDADKKGYITHEALKEALIAQHKALGLPKPERELREEEKAKAKQIADPDGTGKITYENFVKLMHKGIEKAKELGKI